MNENWVRVNLSRYINDDDSIVLKSKESYIVSIKVKDFVQIFSEIEKPNYENLLEPGRSLGYKSFFDKLKDDGILN